MRLRGRMRNDVVGQKVECVDDSPDRAGRPLVVVRGGKYTITSIFYCFGETGILLAEVAPGLAPGWQAKRFRPIIERKTDIGIFTAMLTGKRR